MKLPRRPHARLLRSAAGLALLLALAEDTVAEDTVAEAPAAPACADVEATVAVIQARYDDVRDMEARFSQTTRSIMMGGAGLGDEAPATGRVTLAKPGRMRWQYEAPRESLVLSDGETLWIHDVEAREVTRARVTEGYLAGAALQFLLGEGAIADAFRVELEGCADERVRLWLLPKQDASYEKLLLTADARGVVVGTRIHDLFGNVTDVGCEDVRFDRAPPLERFRWTPVDGVRIVDLEASAGP
jgi:NAD+ synthase (glutamine-hydrolysing)/outer membrane lipoprotein carrier protein